MCATLTSTTWSSSTTTATLQIHRGSLVDLAPALGHAQLALMLNLNSVGRLATVPGFCRDFVLSTVYTQVQRASSTMILPGGFELSIMKPDSQAAFPEVSKGEEHYVLAVPSQPFEVKVTVPANAFNGQSEPNVHVTLTIDGATPGYCHILSQHTRTATFKGFATTVEGKPRTLQFQFGDAQSAEADPTAHSDMASAATTTGSVSATFKVASPTEELYVPPNLDLSAAGSGGLREGEPVLHQSVPANLVKQASPVKAQSSPCARALLTIVHAITPSKQ